MMALCASCGFQIEEGFYNLFSMGISFRWMCNLFDKVCISSGKI